MNMEIRRVLPFIFLVIISVSWGVYYSTNTQFNDFGKANHEWLFLVDGLLVLPILCLVCINERRQALMKAAVYACLAILIGSFIIPDESKIIWPYLESARYLLLVGFLMLEAFAVISMVLAIRLALNRQEDPDAAIEMSVQKYVGSGVLSRILMFETRMWMFLFFAKSISIEQYEGGQHFSYHSKDGAQSTALGFIYLILLELPIVHIIVYFAWSTTAANIISLLSILGLLFLVADYRSISRRPISITPDSLIVRFGILNSKIIAISDIQFVDESVGYIKRKRDVKRYNFSGNPNVVVGVRLKDTTIEKVYIGVDSPKTFIEALRDRLAG
ncbi:hypothetical protein ACJJIU_08780 [Microbulbifer sp. CnH-101-E]|uniref:hypothetical protein n=1 Tax=unclassified Microbulbifer TaxID=2619833 RepID=UPI004039061F